MRTPTQLDLACDAAGIPRLQRRVIIDGDESIVAVVTAVKFNAAQSAYAEVSWMHNGAAVTAWLDPFRLRDAGERYHDRGPVTA